MNYRSFLPMIMLFFLAACAGSPASSTLYLLPPDSSQPVTATTTPTHVLIVRPLQIAEFLNTNGIVLQIDDITLNQASSHRWAEEPALQLQRGLRQRLANRLPDTEVLDSTARSADALQLHVEVDSFQGTHTGGALASGQWQLRDADGAVVVQRSFNAQTRLVTNGYPALVRALGSSWDRVADEIAASIMDLR